MSSDLPEAHADPMAMARSLVTYIDCPDRVFRAVRGEFGTSPCHETIRQLRASHLKPVAHSEPWKPHDGYYPGEAVKAADRANRLFLLRLEAERASSARRQLGAA